MNFAIVDLECTSLKSDQGFLLCGGVKPIGKKPYCVTLADAGFVNGRRTIDGKLAIAIRDEVESFDGIITWNGIMFDVPFLNDRLLFHGAKPMRKMFHIDIMYQARQGKSRMTSSRLDWVARKLHVTDKKTDLDIDLWKEAEAEALAHFSNGRSNFDYIIEHCRKDLLVTEQVYEHLKPRVAMIQKR